MIILYSIAVILTANKTIVELVVNTFDFWYKVCNTVLVIGSGVIHSYGTRKQVEMSY